MSSTARESHSIVMRSPKKFNLHVLAVLSFYCWCPSIFLFLLILARTRIRALFSLLGISDILSFTHTLMAATTIAVPARDEEGGAERPKEKP